MATIVLVVFLGIILAFVVKSKQINDPTTLSCTIYRDPTGFGTTSTVTLENGFSFPVHIDIPKNKIINCRVEIVPPKESNLSGYGYVCLIVDGYITTCRDIDLNP